MHCLRNLQLVMWKRLQQRRRQKARCFLDILLPGMLFVILVVVRHSGQKQRVPECEFEGRGLPSAGLTASFRGMLCGLNNTCHSRTFDPVENPDRTQQNRTLLLQILKYLENLTNYENISIKDNINGLSTEFMGLISHFRGEDSGNLTGSTIAETIFPDVDVMDRVFADEDLVLSLKTIGTLADSKLVVKNLPSILGELEVARCSPSKLQSVLLLPAYADVASVIKELCALPMKTVQHVKNIFAEYLVEEELLKKAEEHSHLVRELQKKWDWWLKIYHHVANITRIITQSNDQQNITRMVKQLVGQHLAVVAALQDRLQVSPDVAHLLGGLQLLCGPSLDVLDLIRRRDFLSNKFSESSRKSKEDKRSYTRDEDASAKCNLLFEKLEMDPLTHYLWWQLKPFVRGRILYSPATPVMQRVMGRVDKFFTGIEELRIEVERWAEEELPQCHQTLHKVLRNAKILKMENVQRVLQIMDKNEYVQQTLDWFDILENSSNSATQLFIKLAGTLQCFLSRKVFPVPTERDAVKLGLSLLEQHNLWAIVLFDNMGKEHENTLPHFVEYRIRMDRMVVDDPQFICERLPRPGPRARFPHDLKYYSSGFIYLQDLLERSIIEEHTAASNLPGFIMRQFPYPCYIQDMFTDAISHTFPLLMILAWVYWCAMMVRTIVVEKELRLTEMERVMGLSNTVLWASWLLEGLIINFITSIILACLLVHGQILGNTDISLICVLLVCYGIASTSFCLLLSTFFDHANIAAAVAGIVFMLTYMPYASIDLWNYYATSAIIFCTGCLSNVAFGFACMQLAAWEEMGLGASWLRVGVSPFQADEFSLLDAMCLLLIDALLYLMATWYISNVWPGHYGLPKPLCFPFTRLYWFGAEEKFEDKEEHWNAEDSSECDDMSVHEDDPEGLTPGIKLVHLTKVFEGGHVAVSDLCLTFYEGQITAFLGHNGAGKTTTMSMLTGLLPPTSGTAFIYGFDIRQDMGTIRKSLGICPQFNILYPKVTVAEHLFLYGQLRDCSGQALESEIQGMLRELDLESKATCFIDQLSGGMQRKLSVATAFIGNCKTIILDEPTAGVDPASRRAIWELLSRNKGGRTIILSTHLMDEAEKLGDRIAIIANGRLECVGSPIYLKGAFNLHYQLTVEIPAHASGRMLNEFRKLKMPERYYCDSRPIEIWLHDMVKDIVLDARLVPAWQLGPEYIYVLPRDQAEDFPELLDFLTELHRCGVIASFSIRDTSLEMIFVRLRSKKIYEQAIDLLGVSTRRRRYRNTDKEDTSSETSGSFSIDSIREELASEEEKPAPTKIQPLEERVASRRQGKGQLEYVGEEKTWRAPSERSIKKARLKQQKGQKGPNPEKEVKPAPPVSVHLQMAALLAKHLHNTRRSWKALISELVVPAVFVILALAMTLMLPWPSSQSPLELTPTLYTLPRELFYALPPAWAPLSVRKTMAPVILQLLGPIGLGTQCVQQAGKENPCYDHSLDDIFRNKTSASNGFSQPTDSEELMSVGSKQYIFSERHHIYFASHAHSEQAPCYENFTKNHTLSIAERQLTLDCSCETGFQHCRQGAAGPAPPVLKVATGEYMFILTGRDIRDWLVKTTNLYDLRRQGGFAFGVESPLGSTEWGIAQNLIEKFWNNVTANWSDHHAYNHIEVWFNNKAWVSSVTYLNAINSVLLRTEVKKTGQNEQTFGIRGYNHPLNNTPEKSTDPQQILQYTQMSIVHAIVVLISLSFVPASFLVFLVQERAIGAKHLQILSGANHCVYWIAELTWDMICYIFSASLCIFVFLIFKEDCYVSSDNLPAFVGLVMMYGWSTIPMMYPVSFLIRDPSAAFVIMACFNMFVGIITTISILLLVILESQSLRMVQVILRQTFLLFPQFCLCQGLIDLATEHAIAEIKDSMLGVGEMPFMLGWSRIGRNLVLMALHGVFFFAVTLLIETKHSWLQKKKEIVLQWSAPPDTDCDVLAERNRVLNIPKNEVNQYSLLLRDMSKMYTRDVLAVDHICLAVQPGECFGLLGLNGAGKSTIFKVLTGAIPESSGDVIVGGKPASNACVGYCPQVDALHSHLTVEEHLELYAILRGVSPKLIQEVLKDIENKMDLWHCRNQAAGTLSGGNRRKLSTAIAIIGSPRLILLDEPTAGMDPEARQTVCRCIGQEISQGCSVFLTSHNMDECEALCTRLTVMVAGRLRCLGSPHQLKKKFGHGYVLGLYSPPDTLEIVTMNLMMRLKGAKVREFHHTYATLELEGVVEADLSEIFRQLEAARRLGILDKYSLSQSTLEEVFLKFAKEVK